MLEIGQIVNTHGLRGEVKVVPWTDYPEDFERIKNVVIKQKNTEIKCTVRSVKYQKNNIILGFSEFKSIEEVEKFKNSVLCAAREELGELPEGVYYIVDLIGMKVIDDEGNDVGKIGDVINKPTDYWYEIEINPETKPQTIIGYDENGEKILKLYPEGSDRE